MIKIFNRYIQIIKSNLIKIKQIIIKMKYILFSFGLEPKLTL
jgi:hypothetical protein